MSRHLFQVQLSAADLLFINFRAISGRRHVGTCLGHLRQKRRFQRRGCFSKNLRRQLQHPRCIGDNLHRLNARNVVKEPSATGVHQLRVALHLHQFHAAHAFQRGERAQLVFLEESLRRLRAAVEHDFDVSVAGRPHIFEELVSFLLGQWNECIAQCVQSLAQRRSPRLVIALLAAVAAAIRAPAFHSVRAAPRGIFDDLCLVLRRKLLQVAAIVGQLDRLVHLQQAQRVGQRHLAVLVMVPIRFPVRRHVNQLRLRVIFEAALESRGQALAGVEQPLEGNGPRCRPVVEKNGNRNAGVEANQIRVCCVHAVAGCIRPARAVLQRSNPLALVRRQHGELDAMLRHQL